ncbi:MAG TPA: RNA-binding S4 domain-containing protein [Bacilli bacterium]|nr:RNA-binding S4 domain-containing protein [Bacilli bacterium]
MRLDKYLKVSRLIKRRTIAKEVSDAERILVNGKIAKASKEIAVGDTIEVTFGKKVVTIKVTNIIDSTKKSDAAEMYELISESTKQ